MIKRYAIVIDGVVKNVAISEDSIEESWIQSDTAEIGDEWDGTAFTSPPVNLESIAKSVRTDRDSRLAVTDFHALSDTDISEAMTTYRQALRDVPQQDEFPNEITWPTEPN